MDWIKTNSPERSWEQGNDYHRHGWAGRVRPDDPVQRPMAYEWMIDLCNRSGTDMWVTLPHVVDDDYVRKLAELIEATLDPSQQCWVEFSNETWNGMFTQSRYVNRKGQELPEACLEGCRYTRENEWYTGQVYHAMRTLQVHRIFLDVFQGQRKRLVLVMGGASAHAFYRDAHWFAIEHKATNPTGVMPDAYALAPYIGHGVDPEDPEAFKKLSGPVLAEKMARVETISNFMKEKGLKMVCYEGGQHIKHTLPAAVPFQKRPEMYDLYMKYLTALSGHMTHFSHYTHSGGSWGAKEYIGEDEAQAPKYRALKDWASRHHPAE
jgi:hypothetical protein